MSCTAIGKETTARLQPNSSSHGTNITAEVARMPAATRSTTKVTPTTIQA